MGEIVNLRRARKRKQAAEHVRHADENRIRHGLTRHQKDLVRTRNEKARRDADAGRIESDMPTTDTPPTSKR